MFCSLVAAATSDGVMGHEHSVLVAAAKGTPEEAPDTGRVDLYVFNALAALMSGTAASLAPLK